MNETLNDIESYFNDTLNAEDRMQFEQRITSDINFAQEVAFYLQARQALRQELLQEKQKSWAAEPVSTQPAPIVGIKKASTVKRWLAAASVIIVLGVSLMLLLNPSNGAQKLATSYVESPDMYSNTMNASQDSLQQGIAALKMDSLDKAEKIFTLYYAAHPDTLDALKFNGIVSLRQKNYDKAIVLFSQLAAIPQYENEGPFYQATAQLLRNGKGDKEKASILLNQVVNENLGNKNKAKQLLQKL